MVKFLLLALAFGLAHAYDELQGKWDTIVVAANNVEKIELGGNLRLYVREVTCNNDCTEMYITFYVNLNGQCSKTTVTGYKQADGTYRTQYEGDNIFQPVYATSKNLVFTGKNTDRAGKETKLIFVLGKSKTLSQEENEKLEALTEKEDIPKENIRDVLATGCPAFQESD
ncbi:odorant-binding protein-like [Peromyscus leucopus]|uniref:odorant-binding protein-like n=1 Tax=Peromyscus leucopus TaxID=10041 RepID=UPI0010A1E1AD|nr:odorant-binding protein-like [Peromyscus leucopus]